MRQTRRLVMGSILSGTWWLAWLIGISSTLVASPACAQTASTWPSKQIRIIVPYAAGGGTDILARVIASKLSESLGRTVIVENKGGGRTAIGYEAVLQEKADGYTLLFNNSSHNIQAAYKGLRYNPETDFEPVSEVCLSSMLLLVRQDHPARSLAEFITWVKQRPGKVSYASFGVGTASHLAGEILNGEQGVDMTHIAYKGSAPALNDLLGGQVDAFFGDPASAGPYVKSGKLKVLAITGTARSKAFADVPTFGELGYKDLSGDGWMGVVVRAGTPPEIVERLATEFRKIVVMPDVVERIHALGGVPFSSNPKEFAQKVHVDMARWKRVVQTRNLSLE